MKNVILLKNFFVETPTPSTKNPSRAATKRRLLGTVLANLAYYGYVPSSEVVDALASCKDVDVQNWWKEIEPALKEVTGARRQIDKFVVYKNFPSEVLEMTEAEYWFKQICMYWGAPAGWFRQEELDRSTMIEGLSLKTLHLAKSNTLENIFNSLLALPARWVDEQRAFVAWFIENNYEVAAKIPFKENMVEVATYLMALNKTVRMNSATDVLRLAVGLSDGDISMRTKSKFRNFKRSERRFLLGALEGCANLEEDVARDKFLWKKLFKNLHPNDYLGKYPHVSATYNKLYRDEAKSFNSKLEHLIKNKSPLAIDFLKDRPGDFMRRLAHLVRTYDAKAAFEFSKTLPRLTPLQLLKISKYLETINYRNSRTIAPKGNWTRLQVLPNTIRLDENLVDFLVREVNYALATKVRTHVDMVNLDESVDRVKLQTNDSDVLPYGRGTRFPIPDEVTFIRGASYWQNDKLAWFDNGFLFYGEDWSPKGVCCWTNVAYPGNYSYWYHRNKKDMKDVAAIFSGDPVNTAEMKGRACQMIDLYIDKLLAQGVRYAVWNILCYSKIKFCDAGDVFAAFQWGEDATAGKLFEPSRCQLSFPLQGDSFAKYICYIDLVDREVIYMDANLKSNVRSAATNLNKIGELMPAFVEYLDTLPSVHDLFKGVQDPRGIPVRYTDEDAPVKSDKAFVFKPANPDSKFNPLDLNKILS